MNYYIEVLKKYATFDGRARRKEYWMFVLFSFLIEVILYSLSALWGIFTILLGIYILATFLPSLAVCMRRLHDIDKSGFWILLGLIPFGGIVLLVFYCLDGTPEENRFGPNPKEQEKQSL